MGGTRRGTTRARGGHVGWMLLVALLGVAAWLVGGLERRVAQSGFQEVETNRVRLDAGETWIDARWEEELAGRLARLGSIDAEDEHERARVLAEIASLSFVASAGPCEVLWPDGMRVRIAFRNPVGTLFVGGAYLAVAADGTILSGEWTAPPQVGGGWLPVIGAAQPHDVAPGDRIEDEERLDALDIAVSMWIHLTEEDWRTLGRTRIDAGRARGTSPEEPGARIYMEGGREIWFGRAPRQGEPGCLPVEQKWAHVRRALEFLRSEAPRVDWEWVDVRWDRAEIRVFEREPPEVDGAGD